MNTIDHSFCTSEVQRYARHFALPLIGKDGQQKLKNAKVLCIGAGGLGSPALLYLAAAGIGTVGVVDDDAVDLSNLQRQILFTTDDIGNQKSISAKNKLSALNPEINIHTIDLRLSRDNALEIIEPYDLVLDCTDNFYARYLINDACVFLNKPDIYASVLRFEGHCSVFSTPQGPCYRCLFPSPPSPEQIPNCSDAGVIGALPGMLGSIQAMEAIKIILNIGNILSGRLLLIDALSMQFKELTIAKNPECSGCSRSFSFDQLEMPQTLCLSIEKEIDLDQLRNMQNQNVSFCILDVREQYEYDIGNLGGQLIPLNQLAHRIHELNKDQDIVIVCQSGQRSKKAAAILENHDFKNVHVLKGGINL